MSAEKAAPMPRWLYAILCALPLIIVLAFGVPALITGGWAWLP